MLFHDRSLFEGNSGTNAFLRGVVAFLCGALVLGALAAVLVCCSLVLGLKDGALVTGDGGDAGIVGDERPVLTPDASTAVCGGGDASVVRNLVADADAVFVLQGGSTIVASCGTKVDPCGTLAVGMQVANANRAKALYVGPGNYTETLNLPSGVAVEGGFAVNGAVWTALCENLTTKLLPEAPTVVVANGVLNAAIRFLTIETKAHGDVGESLFAVRAENSALSLENVNIYSELAGPGAIGSAGTGNDSADTNCSENAAAGAPGSAGAAGAFNATGYQVGATGGVGSSGLRGAGGSYTAPACSNACVASCVNYTYPTDDAGIPVDDAGNEITDGAVGECLMPPKKVCGGDVAPTCGGHGGLGGMGGGNGGASVAVFAVGASTSINITGGALVSAGGGLGAPGGAGAIGTIGDGASSGNDATCFLTCDSQCMQPNSPSTMTAASVTSGGLGGAGGQGGGGAGGPTFLIVIVDGANVTSAQTDQWQIPTAGAMGGQPNGIAGAFGKQSP